MRDSQNLSIRLTQVVTLMWLRTTVMYQYRYGSTTRDAMRHLYSEGGVWRFYKGVLPALLQAPLSRFGDYSRCQPKTSTRNLNPSSRLYYLFLAMECQTILCHACQATPRQTMPCHVMPGDTAANTGTMSLLNVSDSTKHLPTGVKTIVSASMATLWRLTLMPLDTVKSMMQVEGASGLTKLRWGGVGWDWLRWVGKGKASPLCTDDQASAATYY